MLLLNLSDTDATSQDGPSLEFITAIIGSAIFRMQVAEGCAGVAGTVLQTVRYILRK